MSKRRRAGPPGASSKVTLSGTPLEPILTHLAWLADVEATRRRVKLPMGWAFRVYNGAVLLGFRWRQSSALQQALGEQAATKLSRAIDALVKIASAAVDDLRTVKGIKNADTLTVSLGDRKKLAEKLAKLLRLAAKHSPDSGGTIRPTRVRQFEKALAPEMLLGDGAGGSMGGTIDEGLAEYSRALGAVIAVHGPKSAVLSAANRKLARQMAVACLGVAAEHLGAEHKREKKAARALVRSLRATREASRGA